MVHLENYCVKQNIPNIICKINRSVDIVLIDKLIVDLKERSYYT